VRGAPTTFWGKLNRPSPSEEGLEWHPLVDHCADVAAVAEALLHLPVWRARFDSLAGEPLDPAQDARLAVLAALHDLGKFNIGFQAKGREGLGMPAGHVAEAIAVLQGELGQWLADLGAWGDGVSDLLLAALGHHGRPITFQKAVERWRPENWRPTAELDPRAGVAELVSRCRSWFPSAFDPDARALPDRAELTHGFAGLVTLADWIGSDPTCFPFTEDPGADRMECSRRFAQRALRGIGLDYPRADRRDPDDRDAYARIAPEWAQHPRPIQAGILQLPIAAPGTITVVESETGSGKTEAALCRFVQLFEAGLVDGMYFALPTRTAATQLHERGWKAGQQAFREPPPVVLAVPGYFRVDAIRWGRGELPPFEVLWPDADRFRYRGWAGEHPKRYLAGTVSVGTIDQVLLSSLMVAHAHLRATTMLRQLLVVDEVHASDVYMSRILEEVLDRHLRAGGHALLLSATLGGEARARFVSPRARSVSPALSAAAAAPYPLLTHRSGIVTEFGIEHGRQDKLVRLELNPWMDSPDEIAHAAVDAARQGAKVLVLRNTVSGCIATQQAVEAIVVQAGLGSLLFRCAGRPAPHHARFARVDREALDGALNPAFGRVRRPGGCVAVTTQTVQQSLDLDADVLFTDLCPADVLLQRIGRVHRHDNARPAGFESPRVEVLVPKSRDLGTLLDERGAARGSHGLGTVYADLRILEATWRFIEDKPQWRIPGMNREIVERSLHSESLAAIVASSGPRWQLHHQEMLGAQHGRTRLADLNLVDWQRPYAERGFPSEAGVYIKTRLGEGDRRVHFSPAISGPFGMEVREMDVPGWMLAGADPELTAATDVDSRRGATQFRIGRHEFTYDRLGLRRDSASRTDGGEDDGP